MKQFFSSILLLLCGISTVSAQEDSTSFLFNNFQESLIYYKNGRVFGVKTNYNLKGIDLRYEIKVKGENKGFVGLNHFTCLY